MLQHLDTIIAFAAIMLGVSVLGTVLTQILTAISGLRSRSVLWGLQTLLTHIDPDIRDHARKIADAVLRHPLLSHTGRRRATAIRRDEFIDLLKDVMLQNDFANRLNPAAAPARDRGNPRSQSASFKSPAEYAEGIEKWFDTVMERAGEYFALRAKWISAGMAVLLAFVLHLDAIALLDKLSTDTELRASLVQSTGALLQSAEASFAASFNAYTETAVRLKSQRPEAAALAVPPSFISADAAREWIRAQIGDSLQAAALIREYDDLLETVLREKTKSLAVVADSVRADLNQTRFLLIPNPYPSWPYGWREILGMLISSLLLSLGAPFWYNVLKNLASLRPRLAGAVQQESQDRRSTEP